MISSMTGIGKANCSNDFVKIEIEIKSYNSRFLDFTPKSPKVLASFDDLLIKEIKGSLVRGKISINTKVDFQNLNDELDIDIDRLNFYISKANEIKEIANCKESLNINQIIKLPDIFKSTDSVSDIKNLYLDCLGKAIIDINKARFAEGDNLKKEIEKYIVDIQKKINKIRITIGESTDDRLSKYEIKIKDLLSKYKSELDSNRLYQELGIILEKKDIEEEIVRLGSHINLFKKYMLSDEYVGKKLNFLLQEMNREINTIGSKSDDLKINYEVIDIKNKLEQIKEQVQNIL